MAVALNDLKRIPMLAHMPARYHETLCRRGWCANYDAGQLIAMQGEGEPPVFFVVQGTVCGYLSNAEARRQTVAQLSAGSAFFIPPVFTHDASAPTSAQAVTACKLICFHQDDFRQLTVEIPELGQSVLRLLSEKLRHLLGLAHDLGLLSVRGRLASFLLQHFQADRPPSRRWTHDDIAASIGTVREVVSRTLRAFTKEGIIRQENHRIELLDLARLAKESEAMPPSPSLCLTDTQSA
jgi:CRP/FNR family transcriptional regulator